MSFDLSEYEPVADRLVRFWDKHPNGRITTEFVTSPEHLDAGIVIRAAIYRDAADPHPVATGYAHEIQTQRGVNSTSAVENCETSAIGRALANCGFAPKQNRPSREEMQKATAPAEPVSEHQLTLIHTLFGECGYGGTQNRDNRLKVMSAIVARDLGSSKELTMPEATAVIRELRKKVASLPKEAKTDA